VLKPLIARSGARKSCAMLVAKTVEGPDRFLEFGRTLQHPTLEILRVLPQHFPGLGQRPFGRLSSVISARDFRCADNFFVGPRIGETDKETSSARLPWLPGPSDNGRWIRRV